MDDEKEWRESLHAGEEVALVGRFKDSEICVVDRVTKTQVIVGFRRFRVCDGFMVGGDWMSFRIKKPKTEIVSEIRRKKLIKEISAKNLEKLTSDQLERIKSIIDEGKQ